ncbi:Cohesin subunit SA-3 [Seminavis robusta]|uniref:Cohesin subunit SA-3 n=1 Tax=Seminavis robusta TaxID=568900 RepID=A0A9N8DEJ0_9STRA|nr:Cohesin subunit SA-3 [Seminavis robusta]|eukprot:Sro57_g033430.1 Cohesin subunit SA-3 (1578) ;mRNA; f:93439-98612
MATRRSTRDRKPAPSIYDDFKEELKRTPRKTPRKSNDDHDSEDEDDDHSGSDHTSPNNNHNNTHANSDTETKEDTTSSDEESEASVAPKKKRQKSPKRVTVQFKSNTKKRTTKKKQQQPPAAPKSKTRALEALRKRTLQKEETPDNSLTAAILMAVTPAAKKGKKNTVPDDDTPTIPPTRYPDAFAPTIYTPVLEPIAQSVIAVYKQDANKAHISLLNLVFRTVGGAYTTLLQEDQILEDMDDETWEQVVTSIVDDMRRTPPDAILFSANPQGALLEYAKKHNAAQEEFRRILDHFWYLLGTLALTSVHSANNNTESFDIEMVRDLAQRLMELITVGQPDLRAAASVAALQLAWACCDGTLALHSRLATAQRQCKAAKMARTAKKEQALQQVVESIQRSLSDLEEGVLQSIVQCIFMRRYRDSDPQIRASCLKAMRQMSLVRPDLFLTDTYLKYYGWMMSDKEAVVRVAALEGLLAPYVRAEEQAEMSGSIHPLQVIHLGSMDKVVEKFLHNISDRVIDLSTDVQEQAVRLLLALMRNGVLDDVDDLEVWNKINLRALAPDTSPAVRRDALYFVLEQLEAFDTNSPLPDNLSVRRRSLQIDSLAAWVGHALSDGNVPLDNMRVHLTDYIVQSLKDMPRHAHLTTDWGAMLNAIQHDTEAAHQQSQPHRSTIAKQRVLLHMLVCCASLAFEDEIDGGDGNDDEERLLALEDTTFVKAQKQKLQSSATPGTGAASHGGSKKKTKKKSSSSHESLTVGLLKALPQLLLAFKGDITMMRSLTRLPKFLIISVITLPQRKDDVQTLTNLLAEIFMEATDTTVLQNICMALTFLARGNHSRNQEAYLKIREVARDVQTRLFQLIEGGKSAPKKEDDDDDKENQENDDASNREDDASSTARRPRSSRASRSDLSSQQSGDSSPASQSGRSTVTGQTSSRRSEAGNEDDREMDRQYSIALCLCRLRVLSKKWYLGDLLAQETAPGQDESTTIVEMDPCVHLCSTIASNIAKELNLREIILDEADDDSDGSNRLDIPEFWLEADPRIHKTVAQSIREGLYVILSQTAWRFHNAINKEESARDVRTRKARAEDGGSDDDEKSGDDNMEVDDETAEELEMEAKMIVRMRDGLGKLLGKCFDQFLDEAAKEEGPMKAHFAFATNIQLSAGHVAGDLRTLFPRGLAEAASPLLRSCSLADDSHLVGGCVRFFRSKEECLDSPVMGKIMKDSLLLPLSRGLCSAWVGGNRREAGTALAHVAHPSAEVTKAVAALSKVLKKVDPVRLLESHMASLRQTFSDWMDSEPEEPESDLPTEQEMDEFAAAEEEHEEAFKQLELKASRLAASLGVGKLRDEKMYPALFGFVREGMRYAFGSPGGDDEDENVGSRLAFLRIVMKYLTWIKQKKQKVQTLRQFFEEKESELRAHPDFGEIREEDVEAIGLVRKKLGLDPEKPTKKRKRRSSASTLDLDDDGDSLLGTPGSGSRPRVSYAGSVLTFRSSNLSPIDEVASSGDDDDNLPIGELKKRKTTSSPGAILEEGSDEEMEDDRVPIQDLKKRLTSPMSQATIQEGDDEEGESTQGSAASSVPLQTQ